MPVQYRWSMRHSQDEQGQLRRTVPQGKQQGFDRQIKTQQERGGVG